MSATVKGWRFSWPLAILLGAILVVTGPTVIVPLLRHLRLSGSLSPILRWEAILIDPIGVVLAVLVFEVILTGNFQSAPQSAVVELLKSLSCGTLFGIASGYLMVFSLKRYWVPDYLQSVVTLMVVALAFTAANHFRAESGLVAVTVMGMVLANQQKVSIKSILEFKENLRVLLISSLFIILAARLKLESLLAVDVSTLVFFGCLVFVVRPLSVFVSTFGSSLKWREKLFLSWMAPRGIVAAATASIFALSLEAAGYADSERLLTITFVVIIGTVLLYGLTTPLVAYVLKVAHPNPQGLVISGASEWVQNLALVLKDLKFKVLLVDTNTANTRMARRRGLLAVSGNILSEDFASKLDLSGIGHFLGMTPNDEVNSFAALYFSKFLGRKNVYQLSPAQVGSEQKSFYEHLHGRFMFDTKLTHEYIHSFIQQSNVIHARELTDAFDWKALQAEAGDQAHHLFTVSETGDLFVGIPENKAEPKPGMTVIYLARE